MKTEIRKTFQFGFLLNEQELRRTVQTIHDNVAKLGATPPPDCIAFSCLLKDGSKIETHLLDDILALENAGAKLITRMGMVAKDPSPDPVWRIAVEFENAFLNPKSWVSCSYEVLGATRDWAFVAAAELDDRMKRVKLIAFHALLNSRWGLPFFMLFLMICFVASLTFMDPSKKTHIALQQMVDAGSIKDPIQALIALEKLRNERSAWALVFPLIMLPLSFLIPFGTTYLLPKIFPSYNFYWGDYIPYYNKRRSARSIIWTVVILGLIVSIVGSYFAKKMGL